MRYLSLLLVSIVVAACSSPAPQVAAEAPTPSPTPSVRPVAEHGDSNPPDAAALAAAGATFCDAVAAADPADYSVVADRVSRAEGDRLGIASEDVIRAALADCRQMIDAKRAVQAEQIIAAQAAEAAGTASSNTTRSRTSTGGGGTSIDGDTAAWLLACREMVYPITSEYEPDGGWIAFEYAVNLYGVMARDLPASGWRQQVSDTHRWGRQILDGASDDSHFSWWGDALALHEQLIHHCGGLGA